MKKIVIKSCIECYFKDHKGGFAEISYVPICSISGGRTLPYNVGDSYGVATASPTGIIPEWCPLENNNDCIY